MCELLEKARENQGNVSYYAIAKELNVTMQIMNNWKNNKSKPNGEHTLKLVKLANLSIDDALFLVTRNAASPAPEPSSVAGSLYIM